MRELDPQGADDRLKKRSRRRAYHIKGPNFIWHFDSHDKSSGFSVHGCINRFSSRLLWLEVGFKNTNQEVIAKYYLDAVKQVGCQMYLGRSGQTMKPKTVLLKHYTLFLDRPKLMNLLTLDFLLLADPLLIKQLSLSCNMTVTRQKLIFYQYQSLLFPKIKSFREMFYDFRFFRWCHFLVSHTIKISHHGKCL